MRDEWENAHTDYTAPPRRPIPSSLAESESDWRDHLETTAPNGWLLRSNAMTEALASGRPLHLLHVTRGLDAIRASHQLHVSTGCLVGALYCSPLTSRPQGLRPHNLGAYLLRTKPSSTPMIFEVTPDAPVPPKGVDYLHLGAIHLRTYRAYQSYLTPAENDRIHRAVQAGLAVAAPFLDLALRNATGHISAAPAFVDRLAAAVAHVPFLGYLYFEVVSEYLMLHSATPETKAFAQDGELNSLLFKRLAFAAVDGMDQLFDLARFRPGHRRLVELVGGIEPALADGAAEYVRRRLSHLLAVTVLHPTQDAERVAFEGAGLGPLAVVAPGLIGQMVFREIRYLPRYPQLYHCFEKAKALEVWDFWNVEGIPTPFNGTLPKGEIGINPVYPRSAARAWTARIDGQGYLHPDDEVEADFTSHLAAWWAPPRECGTGAGGSRGEPVPGARVPTPSQRLAADGGRA
ncbi:hypothetical protein [Kitasatospora sp. NPDC002040]|uniref:hypothetical protein n=1 Tax=Kitasatospora sp. NPDC002040 TaxID=3154661 RepID=UPI00332B099B